MDRAAFVSRFRNRAIPLAHLPAGSARQLAEHVNRSEGRGDDTLHTKAEVTALFDLLLAESVPPTGGTELVLVDDLGRPSEAGQVVALLEQASIDKPGFFATPMYLVHVTGWPRDQFTPETAVTAPAGASLAVWPTEPGDPRHVPGPGADGVLFTTTTFSLMNSGNRTLRAPKRSWKIDVEPEDGGDSLLGMRRFNLKAMYNDPSQMRESLAWHLFGTAGLASPRHTYAKLAFDDRYFGLFSLVEQVDKAFLKDHFGANDRGNLYKAYCGDIGCATLERRTGSDGDDGGRQYIGTDPADGTYRLKSNEDEPAANTYDDLARFVRVVNGVGLPGGERRFDTDGFRNSAESIMNVWAFLRWAGVNLLLGSWDNYFATPANYYLYNSGLSGADKSFVEQPYFTFIPWDYDNSFGIDYFGTTWQYTDILDWPANTRNYWAKGGRGDHTSSIPLVQNMLSNTDFRRYYLDHLEYLLAGPFMAEAIDDRVRGGRPDALWPRISQVAYLESATPNGQPFTGRQFTNDEVYRAAGEQYELRHADADIEGIVHYVRMRRDSANRQLADLRAAGTPAGTSGARFPVTLEPLPVAP